MMPMPQNKEQESSRMEEQLNLEFLWLPKQEELSDLNSILGKRSEGKIKPAGPLLKLKTCISNFCGFPVFVKDCKKRIELADFSTGEAKKNKTENALFYLEFLFNVCCTVRPELSPEKDFRRFIDLFCSIKHDRLTSDVYLKFDPAIFPLDTKQIHTEERAIDLNRFSLGNFIGLNTFNERFDSKSTLLDKDHKITQVRLQMLHDYKRMLLYFVVGRIAHVKKRNATTHLLHKLEIPYSSLHSIVISKKEGLIVYLRLLLPPLLYAVVEDADEENDYTSFYEVSPRTPWFRAVDLFKGGPSSLRKEFSMNTVLCLDFKLSDYDFLFKLMTHCKSIQLFFAPVVVKKASESPVRFSPKLDDFECHYALQCLLTHSFEVMNQLTNQKDVDELQKFLQEASKANPHALIEALHLNYEAIIKGNVLNFKYSVQYLYERLKTKQPRAVTEDFSKENKEEKVSHLLLIKRAILTPTRLVLLPPQPTLKSRALRDCSPNYSLRVSLRDDNMDTINFTLKGGVRNVQKQKAFFNDFFKTSLLKGFSQHNRLYKYVGNSTSQLKGHGMWFYARDDKMRTADTLRAAFGQLEKIKEVPRYMARMGQTFSQSMGNVKVPQEWTNVNDPEPDVTGGVKQYLVIPDSRAEAKMEKKKFLKVMQSESDPEEAESEEEDDPEPYTFSDGIGRISPELAEVVYKELKVEEEKPCAMQIRYAGCKGMLVVDPRLKGKKILFRKSMVKFNSSHDSLEILKFSEKRSAFLNRPFITILEGLGVNKETFLQLQKEMIQNHITAMFHENSACKFLHRHSLLRFNFLSMFSAGIRFTEDPLFRSMIFALFQKQIELLKNKTNIEIPVNEGRNMFGVMDDTFTLEYGQVFVQYTDWDTDKPVIRTGTIVVTKNPCMHPGDVRKFEAVDVEALHHIKDCIVFPAKGPRPHPDEMAGSDLDGDEYHVMWCKELIFPYDNAPPMHFAHRKENKIVKKDSKSNDNAQSNGDVKFEEDIKCPVQISDELDHFGEFIFSDKVGIIASAHLAWADQQKQGINSEICLRLAAQYSLALDFAKTGRGVSFGQDRVLKYPDFMQKLDEKRTYLSNRALGILYRSCKRLEIGLETERNEIEFKVDNSFVHEKWDTKYKKSAIRVLNQYSDKIEYFIRTHGFENEGQLLAGALINPPKYYENRHDMSNLMALLEFEVQWIFKDLERRFFEEFGGKPKNGVFTDEMLQKASAWYMVTYNKDATKGGSRFFGLPWAVSDVLVQLKNRSSIEVRRQAMPSKSLLETIVDKSVSRHYPNLTPDTDIGVIYDNRLQVLDTALKILTRWVKSQRDYFSDPDFLLISKCISKEFESKTMDIATCSEGYISMLKARGDIKKAISPCYHVIQTMLHVAQIGTQLPQQRLSDVRQEVGLLAWITLIKLACTYNPQYLGIPNEAGVYAETVFYKPQDNIVDTLQLPLFEKDNEDNLKFSQLVTHNFKYLERYLKKQTRIKSINFRIVSGLDNTDFVRFTVVGTRYSIERLKDIVVLDDFFHAAVANEPLLYSY